MKTRLFYVIAFILFVQIVNAQTFGIKGGVNFANVSISTSGIDISPKSITGFHIGPVADFQLKDKLHFNTGLLYSAKGFKMDVNMNEEGESANMSQTYNYLDVPLNLAYLFPINDKSDFFIQAGPYLAYALSGKEKFGSETRDIDFAEDQIKRFDYGVEFGAGVQFGSIVASLNYQLGLADLNDDPDYDASFKNKVFQISLAYMFGKKE